MSVPYSFRTKIQTKRNIWKNKKRHRRNFEKIMCSKGSRNNRGRSVPRPHTYACKYPTAHKYSTIYGISQGEKFANDFRPTRKFKVQVLHQKFLVPRLLCGYGRSKQKGYSRIHKESVRRRLRSRTN